MAKQPEQIVLVGLPGSGKSTVGPILARNLGWRFIDLDGAIEAAEGHSVSDIFTRFGEAEFRRAERELTDRLACEPQLVLAPGGGWIVHNRLPDALIVWLQVDPEIASVRVGERASVRPLLQPDPLERLKQLLEERRHYYEQADIQIDTNDRTPDAVAVAVAVAVDKEHGNQE